jgi:hypothetical protein
MIYSCLAANFSCLDQSHKNKNGRHKIKGGKTHHQVFKIAKKEERINIIKN